MKTQWILLVLFISLTCMVFSYNGGSGTTLSPYQIADSNDLVELSQTSTDWGMQFALTADVNMLDVTLPTIGYDSSLPFTGGFEGGDHTIANLTMNWPGQNNVGLFGYIGSSGSIQNLTLVNATVAGVYNVGGIAGFNQQGTISNCHTSGTVSASSTGQSCSGGLAGSNSGTIIRCSSSCMTSAESTQYAYTGGLVGSNYYGSISDSFATGSVSTSSTSRDSCAGGLAGVNSNDGMIVNCYAAGPTTAVSSSYDTRAGGLVGHNYNVIMNCYSTGPVTSTSSKQTYAGGLVGYMNAGSITNSYSSGAIADLDINIGGLVGYNLNDDPVTNSFWDMETSGQSTSDGGTGKTTLEMKRLSTFLAAGWDLTQIWAIGDNQTYPYLKPAAGINPADLDYSGTVDIQDLSVLAQNWLQSS